MDTPGPRALLRVPAWVWDALAALLVVGSAFARYPGESAAHRSTLGFIAVLLPAAFVLVRRRWPWVVLVACVLCFGVAAFTFPATPMSSLATTVAVYTVAVLTDRRTTVIVGLTVAAVLVLIVALAGRNFILPWTFQIIVTIGFGAALGDAVRSRRAYISEITARAERAEATREAEASRRVAEDRLRIARDLHDVLAHQISVISLNAGVASSTLESRPDAAREALATIRTASREVLGEIGSLLAMLRAPEDRHATEPTPGLDRLTSLLDDFERTGLHTTLRIDGDIALPAAVDLVAYRVIQEGLTNALKHGHSARAHVLIEREPDAIRIVVTNPLETSGAVASGSGNGLLGIRERVSALHGRVEAAPDGGTYRLAVELPLPTDVETAA